jgi:integrase
LGIEAYTTVGKNFERALARAGIRTGDVSFHTLRHTALSRMIAAGHSDHTVMAISGHSTTRMLERYTHPTEALKVSALASADYLDTNWSQNADRRSEADDLDQEAAEL